ncbi:hypothetical protein HUW51_10835 [Adhaeribacter swui]|uniref:Uncharacterized protein n=1 Tax=Adhaeribacter swui TaxID=2086471 RepID=A0A7G7G7R3_9BACT|nr:hypothetical protein [Adhaeribacter swui]QNF33197.1 hypothetical protein HUW51_10835 [Adhaeribacter swui]
MKGINMTIGIVIGFTVIIFLGFLMLKGRTTQASPNISDKVLETKNQTVPDLPVGFGYKCMWFAVKTDDKAKIARILGIKNVKECNWKVGIEKAYAGSIFITPAIDGWTLSCGVGLPHDGSEESIYEVKELLQILSKEFGEAQFFSTHRIVEYHCWMKATDGKVSRVYSYLGESGENILIEGTPIGFEKSLKLANTFSDEAKDNKYFEREDITWADEELVMKIAGEWSIDPSQLDKRKDVAPSLGLLGQK